MSAYVRQISIGGSGNGGRVNGTWLQNNAPFTGVPQLRQNDTLQVVVQVSSGTAPAQLNGYLIVGPAPDAPANQAAASPFKNGSNPLCVQTYQGVTASGGTYTFSPALTLLTPGPGVQKFELTFVAEDPTVNNVRQWEEDPEFDTGN